MVGTPMGTNCAPLLADLFLYSYENEFSEQLFQQMVGIPMGTNCAPLLADLFFYSFKNEFSDKLIKESKRKLARKFNLSYCYIDNWSPCMLCVHMWVNL